MTVLNRDLTEQIQKSLQKLFDSKINKFSSSKGWDEEKYALERPLLTALIEAKQWGLSTFLHSFRTTLGQVCLEEIAYLIASSFSDNAERQKKTMGSIPLKQMLKIDQILEELCLSKKDAKKQGIKREPNWEREIEEIIALAGKEEVTINVTTDLYMKRGEEEFFFEIKSAKPNKKETKAIKHDLLRLKAVSKGSYKTYYAIYDNPDGNRQNYKHGPAMKIFNMKTSPAVLMNREFWDLIGSDGVYKELLNIFRTVGKCNKERLEKALHSLN